MKPLNLSSYFTIETFTINGKNIYDNDSLQAGICRWCRQLIPFSVWKTRFGHEAKHMLWIAITYIIKKFKYVRVTCVRLFLPSPY